MGLACPTSTSKRNSIRFLGGTITTKMNDLLKSMESPLCSKSLEWTSLRTLVTSSPATHLSVTWVKPLMDNRPSNKEPRGFLLIFIASERWLVNNGAERNLDKTASNLQLLKKSRFPCIKRYRALWTCRLQFSSLFGHLRPIIHLVSASFYKCWYCYLHKEDHRCVSVLLWPRP